MKFTRVPIDGPVVGAWADHKTKDLDPRVVTRVGNGEAIVWLDIMGSEQGPFPADNYSYCYVEVESCD